MAGAERRAVLSPWDGRQVGEVSLAGPEELRAAMDAAVEALPRMAAMPKSRRIAILHGMAVAVRMMMGPLHFIVLDQHLYCPRPLFQWTRYSVRVRIRFQFDRCRTFHS